MVATMTRVTNLSLRTEVDALIARAYLRLRAGRGRSTAQLTNPSGQVDRSSSEAEAATNLSLSPRERASLSPPVNEEESDGQ